LRAFPPNEGAVPGTYKVTVEKNLEVSGGSAPSALDAHDAADLAARQGTTKSLIPVKYTKPESSPLTVEIPAGGNRDIKLDVLD